MRAGIFESIHYNVRARMLERHVQLALYTAGSAIALTGAVPMLVLPHAVTAGVSLYIEQEYLMRVSQSRLDLISILAL